MPIILFKSWPGPANGLAGFRWIKRTSELDGGYLGLIGEFYFFENQLQAFSLSTLLPSKKYPKSSILKMLIEILPIDSSTGFYNNFQLQKLDRPLNEFNSLDLKVSAQVKNYMSPTSGIVYGYYGYDPVTILENRKRFNSLKKELHPDDLKIIMHSINPASRLTAIEYFLQTTPPSKRDSATLLWIGEVLRKSPMVTTAYGDIFVKEDARKLLAKFVRVRN